MPSLVPLGELQSVVLLSPREEHRNSEAREHEAPIPRPANVFLSSSFNEQTYERDNEPADDQQPLRSDGREKRADVRDQSDFG